MRGFHDEMGGPESVAGSEWGRGVGMTAAGLPASPGVVVPSDLPTREELIASNRLRAQQLEWQHSQLSPSDGYDELAFRAGEDPSDKPDVPSADKLRHNHLLRRRLADPGYGAVRELSWREKAANGLGVPSVLAAPSPEAMRFVRRNRASPSDM